MQLCHPFGLRFRSQKNSSEPQFHSFLITKEDGTRAYGAALTFYEEVDSRQIHTAMQTLQEMHLAECSNAQSRTLYSHLGPVYRRSPKLGHRVEASTVGKVYDMGRDALYVTKCICVISQLQLIWTFEQLLRSLLAVVVAPPSDGSSLSLESYVYNIINEVPLPPTGRSLKFYVPGGTIVCQRPGIMELPLFDGSLRETLDLLGVDNLLSVLTSMLLEHQILLYSEDCQRLMLVAESISSLVFPFEWPHVYVPILPASLLHFLDAPVPFIMGLHHCTDSKLLTNLCSKANMCFVNIDTQKVEQPEDVPVFPHQTELRDDILNELNRRTNGDGHDSPPTNGHSRDSGFRDSFIATYDDDVNSSDCSASSSMWSIASRLEMLQRSSSALAKITELAKKTGVISSLDDITGCLTEADASRLQNFRPQLDPHVEDLVVNSNIREVVLHYMLQMFGSFESFVIPPSGHDYESWLTNRESFKNFDKAAYLSDQPVAHLSFLSAFMETQMFMSFVDSKIMSHWEMPPANLRVFEERIRRIRGERHDQRFRRYSRGLAAKEGEKLVEKRAAIIDLVVPPPRPLEGSTVVNNTQQHRRGPVFPLLSSQLLTRDMSENKVKCGEVARWRKKDRHHQHSQHLQLSSSQKEKYMQEARSRSGPKPAEANPIAMMHTNGSFVISLLKECKAKTKRMLVEKMGQEAVELGHGEITITGVEENTLIASLCDMFERTWGHGVQSKQGRSDLWSHLLSYQEVEQCNDSNRPIDPNLLTPDLSSAALEADDSCPSGMQTWPLRRHKKKPSRAPDTPVLTPLPVSVTFDMRNVQKMSDICTDVGRARAWVRLALEKKLLSRHFKELLSNSDLTKSLYKKYAFLRCEDEREQFLYHLLSLNAVDYHCFTNTFTNTGIPYRILIFPRQRQLSGSTTTANCWLCLAGQLGETGHVNIPKHTLDLTIDHKNLGILTTLRIGHDNAGISPKWMVEHILARNEATGHTYRFPCGRWLGKSVDDGSLERLLVAEPVSPETNPEELMEKCRTPPRCRSPSMPRKSSDAKLQVSQLQSMLGDAVNNLVKHFYKPEKERGSITGLLCGEYGLVYCMEHIFQYGFKSSRLFRNRFFIWDFLEKVEDYFEVLLLDQAHYRVGDEVALVLQSFCDVISRINRASESVGKDGRFQLFICVGARDHVLHRWIKLMSKTPVAASMYEEQSFMRDPSLLQFLIQIINSLKDFKIELEASLVKGVSV
ncbi:DENN domain-containing protein 5A [Lamellibrachia satsuma]|nr:DENN domain-containing protein 5A [Lamellibrachia satsuma]